MPSSSPACNRANPVGYLFSKQNNFSTFVTWSKERFSFAAAFFGCYSRLECNCFPPSLSAAAQCCSWALLRCGGSSGAWAQRSLQRPDASRLRASGASIHGSIWLPVPHPRCSPCALASEARGCNARFATADADTPLQRRPDRTWYNPSFGDLRDPDLGQAPAGGVLRPTGSLGKRER